MSGADERFARQRGASDPRASVWVAASAGAGKTHLLTDRVVRLLLGGAAPERILCLTFTKAAAAEMAERVHRRLGAWTPLDDGQLREALRQLGEFAPTAEQLVRARTLFARVLETPGGLKVQTIHAFCEALLGRFPVEADVPPNFQVADELLADDLLRAARARALAEDARRAEPHAEALARLIDASRFAELMAALAGERGRLARLLVGRADEAAASLRASLGLGVDDTDESLLAAACADAAFALHDLRRAARALLAGGAKDAAAGQAIADWLAAGTGRGAGFEAYCRGLFTDKGEPRKLGSKKALEAAADLKEVLERECARLDAVRGRRNCLKVAQATAALLGLAAALLTEYEAEKRRRALLDYDDLILKTRGLLERSEAAAWVLWKLDGGLDHILVDEAQDTNPDQWRVIQALADEFFAGEGAREAERTLFVVGDVKQSIYGFQRADPEEFERMRLRFEARAAAAERDWRRIELADSFRSVPAVLDAVDAVFAGPDAAEGLMLPDGVALRHVPIRTGQAGLVEHWPLEEPDEEEDAGWAPPVHPRPGEAPVARLAGRIADRIEFWWRSGERLEAEGRPIAPGDVMILTQRRLPFVPEMVRALKRRGVPVAGVDRMALTEQIAVQDLIALGRFLLLPDDDLALACVLKGPFVGFDEAALFALAHGRGGRLWPALGERRAENAGFAAAHAFLSRQLGRTDRARPFEFYARLLGPDGGRARLLARLGPEANEPIDEFLSMALDFERLRAPSLEGFLRWLEAGGAEIKRDPARPRDEVRVMTVHGAKGLQAPIVFLPDTVYMPHRLPELLWRAEEGPPLWLPTTDFVEPTTRALREAAQSRRDAEHRRLLYVALTRARDRLYVCGWRGKRAAREGCWHGLAERALRGLGSEVDLGDGRKGLRYARPQEAEAQGAAREDGLPAPRPLPGWARREAPAEPAPPRPLAPSRPDAAPPVRPPLARGAAPYRRGELIHRLLQTLPELAPERRAEAGRRYLAKPAHGVPEAAREALLAEALAVLGHRDFARAFGPGSRAEAPLAGLVRGRVVAGQVDRLLVAEDDVLIVDFKTRRPVPPRVEDAPIAYLRQMALYRAVIAQIWPAKAVSCALVWTDGPRIMPLPSSLLDGCAP